jgi:YihY family inner membrane protein
MTVASRITTDEAPASTHPSDEGRPSAAAGPRRPGLLAFWVKINHDWIFNLSGLLAYNFLMASFPILILLLAGAGFVLRVLSPDMQLVLQRSLAKALPPPAGAALVDSVASHLRSSAGGLLLVGVATSVVMGSRLFITLENCFGVVFRLRGRHPILQNVMALGMLTLYIVLIPLLVLTSIVPAAVLGTLDPHARSAGETLLLAVLGLPVALGAALALFWVTYRFVPNRADSGRHIWKGTLFAAALLVVYELLFPLYEQLVLRPGNYGSIAGFAVVILLFFYYLAFILLLGAEVNSWDVGQRETATDIPGILHQVQAHNSTQGAAGPTAGQPQEELQRHRRWLWPRQHRRASGHRARVIQSLWRGETEQAEEEGR